MGLNFPRSALEAAPARASWNMETVYDSIFLLPTRKRHDSGWHLICIVGIDGDKLEKAAYCDDICWLVDGGNRSFRVRSDMTYPGGVAHFWGWETKFKVGCSLSSTDVTVIQAAKV